MHIFNKVEDLQRFLSQKKAEGLQIGFAPTMGALHEGHLSLIRKCKEHTDVSVCSIFVNPTQFNDASDLDKYPRTFEKDAELLRSVGNDVLFYPATEEIYPSDLDTKVDIDFGHLDQVLEGAFRPGHFEGVAQVVNRLLDIVQPHELFMGQKDFQQFMIVQHMINQLQKDVKLVMCPIIRETHGLAMSSRNERLKPIERQQASLLFHILQQISSQLQKNSPSKVCDWAISKLSVPGFRPEYFEIIDGNSLLPLKVYEQKGLTVACLAVWVGDVRLIDNIIVDS